MTSSPDTFGITGLARNCGFTEGRPPLPRSRTVCVKTPRVLPARFLVAAFQQHPRTCVCACVSNYGILLNS